MKAKMVLALALMVLSGSVSAGKPDIVQISKDTYLVTVENHAGIFGSQSTTKKKAIEAANSFAESKGMAVMPLGMEFRGAGGPGQWPVAEYQFQLVPLEQAQSVGLKPRAHTEVEVNIAGNPANAPGGGAQVQKVDLYNELLRLDDLRKRGILTDGEFEIQKARLLARP